MSSLPLATVSAQLQLLLLAVDAALYPTLLAAVVILLNQPRRVALLGTYLAGGLIVSIGAGLLLTFALKGAFHHGNRDLSAAVDLTVGGLALVLAVALATRADARWAQRRGRVDGDDAGAQKGEPLMQRILARESTPLVFFASVLMNLPGAAYIVALKDITAAHHGTGATVLLIVVFNLIMFLLAEIPLAGLIVDPVRTEAAVLRVNAWFSRNGRRIAIALCLLLSLFLILRGIAKV